MVSKDKVSELRAKILPVLLPCGVKRIALFGSIARGEEAALSDIDLLVTLKPRGQRPSMGLKWFALEEELSHIMGRRVDLVSENALSPYIKPYVEKEMVVLYEEG